VVAATHADLINAMYDQSPAAAVAG
jgi:hypothetical protein